MLSNMVNNDMINKIREILKKNYIGKAVCIAGYGLMGALKQYEEVSFDETDTYLILGDIVESDYVWIDKRIISGYREEYNKIWISSSNGQQMQVEIS